MRRKKQWIINLLLPLAVIDSSMAEMEPTLDELLDGFEEELPRLSDESLDTVLDGFGPEESVAIEEADEDGAVPLQAALPLRGHWVNSGSWNIDHSAPINGRPDYRGLSRLSTKLWLELEQPLFPGWKVHGDGFMRHDFSYAIHEESHYPQAVIDQYQQDLELGELWLTGSINPDLDIKLGRQIVVWGQSDYLRVNDTINPMDLREPGLGEIETLRRPLTMARADYYKGEWHWSGMAIVENRPNRIAPCGGEFSATGPLSEAECSVVTVIEQFPGDGLGEMEWGLSAMGRFSGWDLSFYAARLNHDIPYRTLGSNLLRYARVNQLGTALNIAQGSWLWKGEVAYLDGLEYARAGDGSRVDLLLGGEYRGITDVTLSLERVQRQIRHYDAVLITSPDYAPERVYQTLLAYLHNFDNDTLHLKGVVMRNGSTLDEGGYERLSLQYDLDDVWSITTGGIIYHSGSTPPDWGENDRLFIEFRQDF